MENAFENILAELINGDLEKLYSEMNNLDRNELEKQKTKLWEDTKEYVLAN